MPVAFVITHAEEEIVNAVSEGAPKPHMNGNLFTFSAVDVPDFMNRVSAHGSAYEFGSPEFRASTRLIERLGTWVGRKLVASKEAPRSLQPTVDLAEVFPDLSEPTEVPLDEPVEENVSPLKRRKRIAS